MPADEDVDKLYRSVREAYGDSNPMANGYRLQQYFLREQAMLFEQVPDDAGIVVDIACGSGLMIQPLAAPGRTLVGVDYNQDACLAARQNGIDILRGNAFSVPLANACCDLVVNCQFLNQQNSERAKTLIDEVYRILKPGGRLVLVWRNDRAWVHKLAVFIFRYYDRLIGRPDFPHFDNDILDLAAYAKDLGFDIIESRLCFPLLNLRFENFNHIAARALGASCFLVVEKR